MLLPLLGGLMGGSLLLNLWNKFNPSARKLQAEQEAAQKYRSQAALADVEDEYRWNRDVENPRQRAMLRQTNAARGFGKSKDKMDIGNQQMSYLTRAQAREMAALRRNREMARRGLSVIRRQSAYNRRMMPVGIASDVLGAANQAAGAGLFGKVS